MMQSVSENWHILQAMLALNHLSYVDFVLAERVLSVIGSKDQAYAALICHLSMSARQGHLCVTIIEKRIMPSPQEVWQLVDFSEDSFEVSKNLWESLAELILTSTHTVHDLLISEVVDNSIAVSTPLCRYQSHYYLQKFWLQESFFITHVSNLLNRAVPRIVVDMNQVNHLVNKGLIEKRLLNEQAQAIIQGCQHTFTVIIGGPGTGKTYTAGMFLRIFWESLSLEQRKTYKVMLAAPTGKAAANLEKSILRALDGYENVPQIPHGQTLHSLLGMHKKKIEDNSILLDADLVLVDECSMIDVRMMSRLMQALKPGARLILLGDQYQLPPVEAGSLFSDLVCCLKHSKYLSELVVCLRAELHAILEVAKKIKAGDTQALIESFALPSIHSCVKYKSIDQEGQKKGIWIKDLLAYAYPFFPCVQEIPKDPIALLAEFARFRILTPMRRGLLGTEQLNAEFFSKVCYESKDAECFTVPIMITRNHQQLALSNGEIGLLVKFRQDPQRDFALFASRGKGDEIHKVPALLLPAFEYAYCISVHKSQGSEFNHVLMLLPEGSERFGREALYTGVTRAKKVIEIWSSPFVLTEAIKRTTSRHSCVQQRLVVDRF